MGNCLRGYSYVTENKTVKNELQLQDNVPLLNHRDEIFLYDMGNNVIKAKLCLLIFTFHLAAHIYQLFY